MPKSKEYISDEESNSSEEEKPKEKKSKKRLPKEKEDSEKPSKKQKHGSDEELDTSWDIGNNRQVSVREFKGKVLIDIREMYFDKAGDLKPGKKGISLSTQQWRKFVSLIDDVDKAVKAKFYYSNTLLP
ncbi:activated RNA polymerase II transcriptional coactivator p15 [Prorops nasuta]|uniref:activated RNA polymerase II transcriptional coactivator p15 n=1 Tax=Prorops nasuta TaxID=863751 RepID=UPI0034CE58DE